MCEAVKPDQRGRIITTPSGAAALLDLEKGYTFITYREKGRSTRGEKTEEFSYQSLSAVLRAWGAALIGKKKKRPQGRHQKTLRRLHPKKGMVSTIGRAILRLQNRTGTRKNRGFSKGSAIILRGKKKGPPNCCLGTDPITTTIMDPFREELM